MSPTITSPAQLGTLAAAFNRFGMILESGFDGEGKRGKKKVYEANGTTVKEETIFVYSSGKLAEEYSTKPVQNPTTSYTATDHLGSPRVITDSNGNVVSRRDFMPFGDEITNNIGERQAASLKYNAPDNVRQKFTGYQKDDETELDFAEARMYENRHGRFTAVDPLLTSGKSADPQTFNRYVYCVNSPLMCTDPSGLFGDWYHNTKTNTYEEFDDNPGDDWTKVDFGSAAYIRLPRAKTEGETSPGPEFLYRTGGGDNGERAAVIDKLMSFQATFNSYCQIDPKCLGVRNPQMREAAAGVIGGETKFIYDGGAGIYNWTLAWGANSVGLNLPYAPYSTLDDREKPVYTALSVVSIAEGGVGLYRGGTSLFRSARSFINTYRTGLNSFQVASRYGYGSYAALREAVGSNSGFQVHHLIEQRFARTLGVNAEEMLSIVLNPQEHSRFTSAWRQAIPYSNSSSAIRTNTATREQIMNAAREVYRDYPGILRALGL